MNSETGRPDPEEPDSAGIGSEIIMQKLTHSVNSQGMTPLLKSLAKESEESTGKDHMGKFSKDYSPGASELHKDAEKKIKEINDLLKDIKTLVNIPLYHL